jgi:hypothetical protein
MIDGVACVHHNNKYINRNNIMDYAEFQERWEQDAHQEFNFYMSKSASELEDEIKARHYGNYYTIWRVLSIKSTLVRLGWDLFDILKSDEDYLIRYHCALTLINLTGASQYGLEAIQLSGRQKYDVPQYLKMMKSIIEKKLTNVSE